MKVHKSTVKRGRTEKTYPGVGLMITLGSGLLFWSSLAYVVMR